MISVPQISFSSINLRTYFVKNSMTTIIIEFDNGWKLSFRIHNASTLVEVSLKFDVTLLECPPNLYMKIIPF